MARRRGRDHVTVDEELTVSQKSRKQWGMQVRAISRLLVQQITEDMEQEFLRDHPGESFTLDQVSWADLHRRGGRRIAAQTIQNFFYYTLNPTSHTLNVMGTIAGNPDLLQVMRNMSASRHST